jgi:hypothetical protein
MNVSRAGALALTLGVVLGARGAEGPKLRLSDGGYPLWEIRPLDRRVYVVSLDGVWKRPAKSGARYQLGVVFPDGTTYTHRPINDDLFERGEMRFMLPEYLLLRTKAAGGRVKLFVTERLTADARPEVISNGLELTWPLKRAIARRAPATKFSPPRPLDDLPLHGEPPPVPKEEK